jgi:hypothetical protein
VFTDLSEKRTICFLGLFIDHEVRASETSVNFYKTIRRHIPKYSRPALHSCRCENLKNFKKTPWVFCEVVTELINNILVDARFPRVYTLLALRPIFRTESKVLSCGRDRGMVILCGDDEPSRSLESARVGEINMLGLNVVGTLFDNTRVGGSIVRGFCCTMPVMGAYQFWSHGWDLKTHYYCII